jgi:hypothetical protein
MDRLGAAPAKIEVLLSQIAESVLGEMTSADSDPLFGSGWRAY